MGLLGLLQLGVLQPPTITIGQAVLLQEDIITNRAVLHLAKLSLLQVDITTIVLPVLLEVDTTTIVLPVLLPVDATTIGLPVPLQVDTTAIGQQPTAESRSLSG